MEKDCVKLTPSRCSNNRRTDNSQIHERGDSRVTAFCEGATVGLQYVECAFLYGCVCAQNFSWNFCSFKNRNLTQKVSSFLGWDSGVFRQRLVVLSFSLFISLRVSPQSVFGSTAAGDWLKELDQSCDWQGDSWWREWQKGWWRLECLSAQSRQFIFYK